MPIYKGTGNNQTAIYKGEQSMAKVYLGDVLKWQKIGVYDSISFQTNAPSTTTFDPLIHTNINADVEWILGDGTTLNTLNTTTHSISHIYTESTTKTVTVNILTNGATIYGLQIASDYIIGDINLSGYTFGTYPIYIYSNPGITGFSLPKFDTNTVPTLYLQSTSIASLDLNFSGLTVGSSDYTIINANISGLNSFVLDNTKFNRLREFNIGSSNLSGGLDLSSLDTGNPNYIGWNCSNTNITGVTFKNPMTGTCGVRSLSFYNNNLSGNVDLSWIKELYNGSNINFYGNSSLTSITFPTGVTVGDLSFLTLNNCNLSSVDMSWIPAFNSNMQINLSSNTGLTSLTLPTGVNATVRIFSIYNTSLGYVDFTQFDLDMDISTFSVASMGLSAGEVNHYLVDFDNMSTSGYTGRWVDLRTNTAPDSSSGGYDGLAAKASLQVKGFIVYTD